MSNISWTDAQAIADDFGVDEAIRALVENSDNDNAVCMVQAVVKAYRVQQQTEVDDAGQPIPEGVDSEAEGFAMEFVHQVIPELHPRENAAVLLTAAQIEEVLRRVGWRPPSEQRDEVPWQRDNAATWDLLDLVSGMHHVIESDVAGWTDKQCQEAEAWAGAVHFKASDNDDVVVPPMPEHVRAATPRGGVVNGDRLNLWSN